MLARAAALVAARASALAPANAARAFAAAAHEFKLPDAPLVLSSTSGSIATLTWQIACKENALEKVQDELAQMVEVFATQPKLRELALDPFVPRVARVKIMSDLLKDSGATEITKRLFLSLAGDDRPVAARLRAARASSRLRCRIVPGALQRRRGRRLCGVEWRRWQLQALLDGSSSDFRRARGAGSQQHHHVQQQQQQQQQQHLPASCSGRLNPGQAATAAPPPPPAARPPPHPTRSPPASPLPALPCTRRGERAGGDAAGLQRLR